MNRESMNDGWAKMLEAQVQFELDSWRGESASASAEQLIDGVLGWVGPMRVDELFEPAPLTAWVQRLVAGVPQAEGMALIEGTVLDAYRALLAEHGVQLGDIVPRTSYDLFVSGAIGMTEIRDEVITQITTNSVYSGLISYVLYNGIKKYLISENPIVRRVPGVSTVLRAGGNAVRSATPRLGEGINRRLVAFIQANVQEAVKDSGQFLDGVLDDAMLRTLVDEIWADYAGRSVAELTGLANGESIEQFVVGYRGIWLKLRESLLYGRVLERVVEGLFEAQGGKSVAAVLDELGLTRELLAAEFTPVVRALAEKGLKDGYLETRIRARLEPFYAEYFRAD